MRTFPIWIAIASLLGLAADTEKGKLTYEAETVTRGNATTYEPTYGKGGKKHEFAVKPDGAAAKD